MNDFFISKHDQSILNCIPSGRSQYNSLNKSQMSDKKQKIADVVLQMTKTQMWLQTYVYRLAAGQVNSTLIRGEEYCGYYILLYSSR